MVHERGCDIRGTESFLKQTFNDVILLLVISALQCGSKLVEKYYGTRFFDLTDRWRFAALDSYFRKALDIVDLKHLSSGNK